MNNFCEVGHLYVGDDYTGILSPISIYKEVMSNHSAVIMIDDYHNPCLPAQVEQYVSGLVSWCGMRDMRPLIILESDMVGHAVDLLRSVPPSFVKHDGNSVYYKDSKNSFKISEMSDEKGVRYTCPTLVASLFFHLKKEYGAIDMSSIVDEKYRNNEKRADILMRHSDISRRVIFHQP